MDGYVLTVWVLRIGLGALGAWVGLKLYQEGITSRGPSFKPPKAYGHETVVTAKEYGGLERQLKQPLRQAAKPNISDALSRLARIIPKMTHAELAKALEAAEWNALFYTGPQQGLAVLQVAGIRRELTRRAERATLAALDPHPLEVTA